MTSAHIQTSTLRRYLLGTLSDEHAETIDERYFSDASFFKRLRVAEAQLVCDYLDGKLNVGDRQKFERRYLRVPELRKLVDEIRSRRQTSHRPSGSRMVQLAMAGALSCAAILAVVTFLHHHDSRPSTPTQTASVESSAAEVSLILTPGATKGPGSLMTAIVLPDQPQNLLLAADLPGQFYPATYTTRLLSVDMEGLQKEVWTAKGLQSIPSRGGQRVIIKLSSATISPGDYILELKMESGDTRETYLFRANPPRNPDVRR